MIKNIARQPKSTTRYDVIGAPSTAERGIATSPKDKARARSAGGSQSLTVRVMAGKGGPSVTPSSKRRQMNPPNPPAKPSSPTQSDQAIAAKDQTIRGPQRSTSHPPSAVITTYPRPKAERIIPNCVS